MIDYHDKNRQKAMDVNYKLGKYGFKYCDYCGQIIDNYDQAKKGLCENCQDNY